MARFGKEDWQSVSQEMMDFEADVSVVPGSSRPRTLETERMQWMEFLKIIGAFPQLAMSPLLLKETANKFEYISQPMIDELAALAEKMMQVNANQAGRNQGGQAPGAGQPAQQGLAGMMSAVTGGNGMAG